MIKNEIFNISCFLITKTLASFRLYYCLLKLEFMKYAFLFSIVLLLSSCENEFIPKLIGSWEGTEVTEMGKSMKLNPVDVKFNFTNEGVYDFQFLTLKESGNFHMDADRIIFQDTTHDERLKKAIKILEIDESKATFQMNANGKEQIIKMVKK